MSYEDFSIKERACRICSECGEPTRRPTCICQEDDDFGHGIDGLEDLESIDGVNEEDYAWD